MDPSDDGALLGLLLLRLEREEQPAGDLALLVLRAQHRVGLLDRGVRVKEEAELRGEHPRLRAAPQPRLWC